ncbi:ribosomal protein S12 methylthiotransferase accessory factor [Haloplanus vescus]|uniref:Ribosomal protein S12 methylthiotransferase accessory factor n=1 Tax=Haloplanus vescus TaxID=555874 RepID=A0A1H3YGC5_9EURY|nr:YcaO-like family protein [Haloplanus vescus]SEA09972.1 ribosomal protein S12 methylthiotransferase accessory factor [Haloplanus vescus]
MDVGIAGTGPAAESVRAALDDIDATPTTATPDEFGSYPLGVVIAPAGAPAFERADDAARRWVAVEIGGLGGRVIPDLDAAVSVFADGVGYRDLQMRVAAAAEEETTGDATGSRSAVRLAGAVAGHRAVSLLSGDDVAGTVVEVPGAERRVHRVPRPAERDRTLRRDHRDASLDDALARGEQAVDDRVGLVTQVGERESFPVPYYLATTTDTTAFSDARAAPFTAGVDHDWDRAFMKALGEGLERYCAGVYHTDAFTTAPPSAETVDGRRTVSPAAFVQPEGDTSDDDIPWVPGEDLATDAEVALPASLVHYPPPAERPRPAITTGLGLGNSGSEALRSGLYEVIERDAAMLSWYSTYEPLGLSVADEGFEALVDRARAEDLTVTPLLLTADVDVPVVAVAVHREGEWPQFAVGTGADLDAVAAARGALAEALQNWMELRAMGPEQAREEEGAIGHYGTFPPDAQAFVDSDGDVPASSVGADVSGAAELDALVERASDALSVYAARVTTPDVADLGFEAVRVLSPEAQPLFVDEPYFGERIETVPQELGYEPRPNRAFHPFP